MTTIHLPPAEETLAQFLERRERELSALVSALRGQLHPIEAELAQIQKFKNFIAAARGAGITDLASDTILSPPPRNANWTGDSSPVSQLAQALAARCERMTIKELVIQALIDHFPNGGTLAQIRDFIRDGYGRVIEPSSLRPQMHRLKADGILGQEPSTDTWNFRDGKRLGYTMFDHPTSRAAMKELQDDPTNIESNSLAGKLGP